VNCSLALGTPLPIAGVMLAGVAVGAAAMVVGVWMHGAI
jgi:hypothetical protein